MVLIQKETKPEVQKKALEINDGSLPTCGDNGDGEKTRI